MPTFAWIAHMPYGLTAYATRVEMIWYGYGCRIPAFPLGGSHLIEGTFDEWELYYLNGARGGKMIGREPTSRIVTREELASRVADAQEILDDLMVIESSIPRIIIGSRTLVWLRAVIANQRNTITANKRLAEGVLNQFDRKNVRIAKVEFPLNTITVGGTPI